ncbi:hypothetical protein [Hymenobacter sp. GOD-10R]|uniref:hypothetical protein n=1 Tax=Hymenobacter sp. GOD-10R TaxID=3093922 RepID=UPI002D766136|nr:hypothetical protein [Hymenobacter sp. GOD-10R]WRQ31793.1 hypothetical protein SD425_28505 [Hymenobacter sp. GOD-10R]
MPSTPSPLPAFLQLGANGIALLSTADIVAITRDTLPVTDQNRDACIGYISPEGQVHRVIVHLRDGRDLPYVCSSEELQYHMMGQIGAILQAHVIPGGQGSVEKAERRKRTAPA